MFLEKEGKSYYIYFKGGKPKGRYLNNPSDDVAKSCCWSWDQDVKRLSPSPIAHCLQCFCRLAAFDLGV